MDNQLEAMRAELAGVMLALEAGLTQADNRDALQSQFQQVITNSYNYTLSCNAFTFPL